MQSRTALLALASLLLAAPCLAQGASPGFEAANPAAPLPAELRRYLDAALDTMQHNSMRRDSIDWPAFRRATHELASGAQRIEELHAVIVSAIRRMGDIHGFLRPPPAATGGMVPAGMVPAPRAAPRPGGSRVGDRVGYLWIPNFSGDSAAGSAYADSLHQAIVGLDTGGVCGWIVDLRGNGGGNMWPMLAGVGPVLGEGTAGYFLPPVGERTPWGFARGGSFLGNLTLTRVSGAPHALRSADPPVAVLTGPITASSGEAVLVAFRGRPNTRTFGAATAGYSTANQTYLLSDGALLALATARYVDRTGRVYGATIAPDVTVEPARVTAPSTDDAAVRAASEWLRSQAACSR